MRRSSLDRVCEQLRELHPEFRAALTWHALRRVLGREGIILMRLPIRGRAHVASQDGCAVIAVHSDATSAQALRWATHEYAHVKLHFPEADDGELVRAVAPVRRDDEAERDCQYLAACLLAGPSCEIAWTPVHRRPPEATERPRGRPVPVITSVPLLPPRPRTPRPRVFFSHSRETEDGIHHAIRVVKKFRRFG